jgi:Tol biopolymer transport system component
VVSPPSVSVTSSAARLGAPVELPLSTDPPVSTAPGSAAPLSTSAGAGETAPGKVDAVPLRPVRALPAAETTAFSPAFSSEGTALFFQTGGTHDPSSAIAVARLDGGSTADLRIMKIVDDGARNYHAQPSPDGRMIAFDSDRDGVRGVYVANRDGAHVRRISGEGYAALPSWSPDGSRLAFVRAEPNAPSVWNIWIQPSAGGTPQRVTRYRYGQTWTASWFPDGHRIAYSHEDELTILDLTTSHAQHFTAPVRRSLVRTPAVSPDGSRVVFQVFRSGVWMLNVHDGSMECVLADPTAEEFAWAPDGNRFAFHSRRNGEWGIYVVTASATAP